MMVSGDGTKFLLCYPSCFVAQKAKKKKEKKTKNHKTGSILRLRSKSVAALRVLMCTAQCKHTTNSPDVRLRRASTP